MFYTFTIFLKIWPDIIMKNMMSVKPETKHLKIFIFPKVDVVLIVIWLGKYILVRRSRRTFLVGAKQSYTARGDASGKEIFKLFLQISQSFKAVIIWATYNDSKCNFWNFWKYFSLRGPLGAFWFLLAVHWQCRTPGFFQIFADFKPLNSFSSKTVCSFSFSFFFPKIPRSICLTWPKINE